jgi:hypothetical protein
MLMYNTVPRAQKQNKWKQTFMSMGVSGFVFDMDEI